MGVLVRGVVDTPLGVHTHRVNHLHDGARNLTMGGHDRLSVNLTTEDTSIDRSDLKELADERDLNSVSELIRQLIEEELED